MSTHTQGHPCRGPPKQSLIVCNYGDRVRNSREMATVANMVRTVCLGLVFKNNNIALTDRFGTPVLIAAAENGANPLVDENCYPATPIDTTLLNSDPPDNMDTTELGALVGRNSFAHVAGPLVKDCKGNINYNLMMRGYNKKGAVPRTVNGYSGIELYHDGTDALTVFSSGSTVQTVDPGTPNEKKLTNYEDGETVRFRVSGTGTSLGLRTFTIEKRTTNSSEPSTEATWVPWFRLV